MLESTVSYINGNIGSFIIRSHLQFCKYDINILFLGGMVTHEILGVYKPMTIFGGYGNSQQFLEGYASL